MEINMLQQELVMYEKQSHCLKEQVVDLESKQNSAEEKIRALSETVMELKDALEESKAELMHIKNN